MILAILRFIHRFLILADVFFKSLPCPHSGRDKAQHLYLLSDSAAHVPVAEFAGAQLGDSADTAGLVVGFEIQNREPAAGFERQQNLHVGKLEVGNCDVGQGSRFQLGQMLELP